MENEGYLGRINHPARSNHSVIRFQMEENDWAQYSPYACFVDILSSFMVAQTNAHQSIDVWFVSYQLFEAFPGC